MKTNRKVTKLQLEGDSLTISYDNGDFTCATVQVEKVAAILEAKLPEVVQPEEMLTESDS